MYYSLHQFKIPQNNHNLFFDYFRSTPRANNQMIHAHYTSLIESVSIFIHWVNAKHVHCILNSASPLTYLSRLITVILSTSFLLFTIPFRNYSRSLYALIFFRCFSYVFQCQFSWINRVLYFWNMNLTAIIFQQLRHKTRKQNIRLLWWA